MKEGGRLLFRLLAVAGVAILAALVLAILHAAALAGETPEAERNEAIAPVEAAAPVQGDEATPAQEDSAEVPVPELPSDEPGDIGESAATPDAPLSPDSAFDTTAAPEGLEASEGPGLEFPAEALPGTTPVGDGGPGGTGDRAEGIIHIVEEGDTLWDLSDKYLGSPWMWPEIWERNRFLTNPHYIYPGIRIVIVLPPARDYMFDRTERVLVGEGTAATSPVDPGVGRRVLGIAPQEIVRAGEFVRKRPSGIGAIRDGRQPRVTFSKGDQVYLRLDREIPPGQMLGVYRIRGPVKGPAGRGVSGYVKYLVGVVQVTGMERRATTGVVRASYEDLLRTDVVSEELPGYTPVFVDPGEEGMESAVITARYENTEMATGDFVFLDRGEDAGVSVGNVFRILTDRTGMSPRFFEEKDDIRIEVAKAVVVKTNSDFSTAYVTRSQQSFAAGSVAVRGARLSP
jgi:hypothetical protein